MLKVIRKRKFNNGIVYAMETKDKYPIEVTDTFLPYYTKNAIGEKQNKLKNYDVGSRIERWMIGISCMSSCVVRCKFCATGKLKKYKKLTAKEMVDQIEFIIDKNSEFNPNNSKEFKINYTRMGEPFLNINNIKKTINIIDNKYNNVHHYISTIGIKNSDFSWIKNNITLQLSIHSLNEKYRDWLIPYKNKMTLKELGKIRTKSNLKTTLNLTLTNNEELNVEKLNKYFDPNYFFIKLSPLNENLISNNNNIKGLVKNINLA